MQKMKTDDESYVKTLEIRKFLDGPESVYQKQELRNAPTATFKFEGDRAIISKVEDALKNGKIPALTKEEWNSVNISRKASGKYYDYDAERFQEYLRGNKYEEPANLKEFNEILRSVTPVRIPGAGATVSAPREERTGKTTTTIVFVRDATKQQEGAYKFEFEMAKGESLGTKGKDYETVKAALDKMPEENITVYRTSYDGKTIIATLTPEEKKEAVKFYLSKLKDTQGFTSSPDVFGSL